MKKIILIMMTLIMIAGVGINNFAMIKPVEVYAKSKVSHSKKATLNRLKKNTTLEKKKDDGKINYIFEYGGEENQWNIKYTQSNSFVEMYNSDISQIFAEALGNDCEYDNFFIKYSFKDKEYRMYFEPDYNSEKISIVTYNSKTKKYTLNADGKLYYASKEFKKYLNDSNVPTLLKDELKLFKSDLKKMNIKYKTVTSITRKNCSKYLK